MNENLPDNPQIQVLKSGKSGLFTNYIYKAIPLAFDESMSYYETLCGLLNYLKNVVIPTVNNNADAVAELQSLYEELRTYVDNYFTNLDVQDEINNKLDEMVEDGTLPEIVASYLETKAIFGFDNVTSMKNSTNLINGSYAETLGYYSKNDGGASLYKIREITNEDVIDEASIISLSNNLIAEIIINNNLNILQFGVKNDGVTNVTDKFKNAISYCLNNKLNLYLPSGTYLINDDIIINNSINIIGENKNNTIIKQNEVDKYIFVINQKYIKISDIQFLAPNNYNSSLIKITTDTFHIWSTIINNCLFIGSNENGNGIEINPNENLNYGLMNTIIEKCDFHNLYSAIYINIKNNAWANCGAIKNCWQYACVYGILFNENSNGINYWNIVNFSGQYINNISNTHIKNLKGDNNKIDTCILYDGGFGIDITPYARRTTIINCKTGYYPIHDLGYLTNIINDGEDIDGTYIELNETFIGSNVFAKTGSTESSSTLTANSGSPRCTLSTGAVANNYAKLDLNKQLIYSRNLQLRQNFGFILSDITNVKFYLGIELGLDGAFQGTFLKYDSSIDNKLHIVQKTGANELLNEEVLTLQLDKWYNVQLIRDNYTDKVYLWINNTYIMSINNSLNYNAQPYFRIETLEAVDKKIQLRNVKCRTFHYNT